MALGHLSWTVTKTAASGADYIAVIALFGGVASVGILGSLLAAVLTGAAVASLVMAFSATVENEGGHVQRAVPVVIPMTLFSGTFLPIDRLPGWVQPITWTSPLWHGTELARDAALGSWRPLAALGHVTYLAVLVGLGTVLVTRNFGRRLRR